MMHCMFYPISHSIHRHCLVSTRCCGSERASWQGRTIVKIPHVSCSS